MMMMKLFVYEKIGGGSKYQIKRPEIFSEQKLA